MLSERLWMKWWSEVKLPMSAGAAGVISEGVGEDFGGDGFRFWHTVFENGVHFFTSSSPDLHLEFLRNNNNIQKSEKALELHPGCLLNEINELFKKPKNTELAHYPEFASNANVHCRAASNYDFNYGNVWWAALNIRKVN